MDETKIAEKIKEMAGEKGKINCAQAHSLATQLNIQPATIGRVCNKLEIKIGGCELGLFK